MFIRKHKTTFTIVVAPKIPKPNKRNTISGNLHCSKRISSNFDEIKEKFINADYLFSFVNSVATEFQKGKKCGDEIFIFPPNFFEITKAFISIKNTPTVNSMKLNQRNFWKKFYKFNNNSSELHQCGKL